MTRFTNPLSHIKVAAPCSADWNEMIGNERQRFCGECKLNVYNLSGMSQREAENLLLNSEGRVCIRFYRRADGTILTKDCPVGWQAIKQRVSKTATAFASLVFAAVSGVGLANYFSQSNEPRMMESVPPITEKLKIDEIVVGEIVANSEIQETPTLTMGKAVVENTAIAGMAYNVEEVKQHLRRTRKR